MPVYILLTYILLFTLLTTHSHTDSYPVLHSYQNKNMSVIIKATPSDQLQSYTNQLIKYHINYPNNFMLSSTQDNLSVNIMSKSISNNSIHMDALNRKIFIPSPDGTVSAKTIFQTLKPTFGCNLAGIHPQVTCTYISIENYRSTSGVQGYLISRNYQLAGQNQVFSDPIYIMTTVNSDFPFILISLLNSSDENLVTLKTIVNSFSYANK